MELTILESTNTGLRAGYRCPCGCTPSVAYQRGAGVVADGCCCGNHFAIGPSAASSLTPDEGFHLETTPFPAGWGESLEAAWLVGPSLHAPEAGHDHHGDEWHHGEGAAGEGVTGVVDPVCGMTVEPESARARGLHSSYEGRDYFFCGKGCKLKFDDDPGRYLDPGYIPSM